jgi:hypothetical protein
LRSHFVYTELFGGLYDSTATNRSVPGGVGLSQRVLPVFYWSPRGHI